MLVLFATKRASPFPCSLMKNAKLIRSWSSKAQTCFTYGVSDNTQARDRAKAAGHSQHKLGRNPFQLGGSFVFGPGDVGRFAHRSETFSDNAPIRALLAALP